MLLLLFCERIVICAPFLNVRCARVWNFTIGTTTFPTLYPEWFLQMTPRYFFSLFSLLTDLTRNIVRVTLFHLSMYVLYVCISMYNGQLVGYILVLPTYQDYYFYTKPERVKYLVSASIDSIFTFSLLQ